MVRGWRLLFYAIITAAVLSIAYITVKFILTEKLVEATGDPELAVRQRAARKIMRRSGSPSGRRKAMEFLGKQPQPVRSNVVWAVEELRSGEQATTAVDWIVDIACDLSGEIPTGDDDWDAGRLAVTRIGEPAVEPLIERLGETTQRTLERETYAHRRAVAARLLGILRDPRATEPLIAALRDEYRSVRDQAAAALVRLNTPASREALEAYLQPLLAVLDGQYLCYVRLDSEGRIRQDIDRQDLLYGPFTVTVKPHDQATEEDLARQRDSAEEILKKEEARMAETRKRLEEGKRGHVVHTIKGPAELAIEKVSVTREGLTVSDPVHGSFDLIEGEPMEVKVDVVNKGPGDIVNDFFVAVYGASPPPKNHLDRPAEGPFKGERARDNRSLVEPVEERHLRTMYASDRRETPEDDTRDSVYLTVRFNTVEADRIGAIRLLMNVASELAVPALGRALDDPSYTVRRQACLALQRILEARQTSEAGREKVAALLREKGLASTDAVVRCEAAEALRLSRDEASIDALIGLLLSERDPSVRLVATRALAALPDVPRAKLMQFLSSSDPAVRLAAPRLFAKPGDAPVAQSLLFSGDAAVAREVLRWQHHLLLTTDLVGAMRLKDGRVRAQAARLLADRDDPASRDALLAALKDPEGDVRAAAATGLGELLKGSDEPDPVVVAALVQVINSEAGDYVGVKADEEPPDPESAVITDKNSRAAAVAALAELKQNVAKDALVSALSDTSPDVLAAVMPAVESSTLGDQSERLIKIIGDNKVPARVRQAAELALWRTESTSEESLDALVGLLNDPNNTVKTTAAVALIGLGDSRGDKVLKDQITSKSDEVRREAATLLATLPEETVKQVKGLRKKDRDGLNILLEDLYEWGSLSANFRFLCRSLVFLGDQPRTAERMREALTDTHPVLRAAGLTVLTELGDPTAAETAKAMLKDANEIPRAAAARAAAKLRLRDLTPELVAMLQTEPDPSQAVRGAVREALAQFGRAE